MSGNRHPTNWVWWPLLPSLRNAWEVSSAAYLPRRQAEQGLVGASENWAFTSRYIAKRDAYIRIIRGTEHRSWFVFEELSRGRQRRGEYGSRSRTSQTR
jgi:hypothetical protein